ncbi:subtilisin family serine protease [Arthrobacter sp. B3I9]|uniref:S8 family serine peptidase n=1 Tax=Arthrobacter sp. B3I9 TaxID=3042270 RepID=UPI0027938837|nr:S8 family serine peptidase [Arthrobacter sp. B3I9]MDQ0850488.1 subtilisin family serine protease [Arthrobacter sp. B3I9]
MDELPGGHRENQSSTPFTPMVLDKSVIAMPLLRILAQEGKGKDSDDASGPAPDSSPVGVILDLNLEFRGGRDKARQRLTKLIEEAKSGAGTGSAIQGINTSKTHRQYVFARLQPDVIRELVRLDQLEKSSAGQAIYRIWPDFKIGTLTTKSVSTVKADAARVSFSAFGRDMVWAVLDSGIDGSHPHFSAHKNLDVVTPLRHRDFTGSGSPLKDALGHGTHVAGIIAGTLAADAVPGNKIFAATRQRDENGEVTLSKLELEAISGMAPQCKLVSLKVLDDNGQGEVSSLIAAIDEIQRG